MKREPRDRFLREVDPASPQGAEPCGSPLDTAELEAAVRFVAGSVPHLSLALAWLIAVSPDVAEEMTRVAVPPSHLRREARE